MKRIIIGISAILLLSAFGLYVKQIIPETVESRNPGQQYVVVLGDSVAAGAGLSNDRNQSNGGCDVTNIAFPFLLGKQLHLPIEQFACSGATVAGTSTNTLLGAQYDAAKSFISGSDVIVYAGANDIGWLQTLISCTQTNCATAQTSKTITAKLQQLQKNLTLLLQQLQQSHPHRLLVDTYYGLLAPGDTCLARLGITTQEVNFIHDEEMQLNAAITSAAVQAHATPVAIDFNGHTLCNAQSWVQNVSDNAPLHPTAAGQQQIANQNALTLTAAAAH